MQVPGLFSGPGQREGAVLFGAPLCRCVSMLFEELEAHLSAACLPVRLWSVGAGVGVNLEGSDKEKPVMLLSHFPSSSARPTAQVLPVQNETGCGPVGLHPLPPQLLPSASHLSPIQMLSSLHKTNRGGANGKVL
ncbi:Zinc finger CCHC domain-containing protein 14 [Sciurus carolinensis]|uniref:Zinc finger CCHC domain-containing protein 14 n=1 Tax=Sciurus carolinensis TaxID=30640 RepID=A0AA41N0U6_SCICA|nr:Zinc finger CCHC domain-containing protein 14 [Sciurus carolinensis]